MESFCQVHNIFNNEVHHHTTFSEAHTIFPRSKPFLIIQYNIVQHSPRSITFSGVRDASDGAIAAANERGRDGRGPVGRLQTHLNDRIVKHIHLRAGRQKGVKVTLDSLIKKAAKGFVTHLYVRLCQMNAA